MGEIILPYKWHPREYQMDLWTYMEGTEEGKRAAAVWHRRSGKDVTAINVVSVKAQERVGLYWHLLPTYKQGRAIVWNGATRDGRPFLDHFHPDLVAAKNSTEMRITFQNGSQYQVVGTDDVNSLVGTNPIGCIFSEYSLHDPAAWNFLRPILLENGGWALFIYTARGRNHGHTLLEMAKKNERWFSQVLVAGDNGTRRMDGSPVFPDSAIQEERDSGMPEEMIQQEYYCSFEAPFVGAYYGSHMMQMEKSGRIIKDRELWDPKLEVDTSWDLGVNDTMSIWFLQEYHGEVRAVDYYENSGEGLAHYIKVMRGQAPGFERMAQYTYRTHYAPHDIEVRELTSGKTRKETARSLGLRFRTGKQLPIDDGIEAVRNLLPRVWIHEKNCERGLEALRQYRKKWDEKNKCFMNSPLHDWTSNAASAFKEFAIGRRERSSTGSRPRVPQERAEDNYAYM